MQYMVIMKQHFILKMEKYIMGEFPKNGKVLVKEFILKYKNELKEMWDKEVYKKLPPLQ